MTSPHAEPEAASAGKLPGRLATFACILGGVAAILYYVLLARPDLNPFGAEPAGLTFNSMLSHMLQGRWDVDPATIGGEAFLHDGRIYAYFGPFPAFLRLPLLLVPRWRELHVERLSCWAAMLLGAAAQAGAIKAALSRTPRTTWLVLAPPLLMCCALGGPPMMLAWKGALIYHESILWAWALAMVFVLLAVRGLVGRSASARPTLSATTLGLMGICAGLCLLTRGTTGIGLFAALGLLVLRTLVPGPAMRSDPDYTFARFLRGTLCRTETWLPALTASTFGMLAALVNLGRWGNPLCFADLRAQVYLTAVFPDRLTRLDQYGLFDLRRIWFGLLYYFAPLWGSWPDAVLPLDGRIGELFDALELPSSSIALTDMLWCVLAWRGVALILRGRALPGAAALATGLCLAPMLMLMAWYMAFRYRVEFNPLLFALSCVGLAGWAPRLSASEAGRGRLVLLCLSIVQILSVVVFGGLYRGAAMGPSPGYSGVDIWP